MEQLNRRSALSLSLIGGAATSLFAFAAPAGAKELNYGPNDGKELSPGRRLVELGSINSQIAAYKSITMIDVIYQPGAADPKEEIMDNDMVCHIMSGEFKIKKGPMEFVVKDGDVYTCGKGKTDHATNISTVVGVHRIAILIPV
jgi:hypothetical protein